MYSSLTKNNDRKDSIKRHIDNMRRQKSMIIPLYYYRYKC